MKIASRVVDLTPIDSLPMGGFSGPERLTHGCHGRLEANIALFGIPPAAVAIVSLDTLFAGPDLTERVSKSFTRIHGLPAERVLVLASHTHFAPMLDRTKPKLGRLAGSELDRCCTLLDHAIAGLDGADATHVRVGSGASEKSVNRRLRWRWPTLVRALGMVSSDVYMCDNPDGPRDPQIRVFMYESSNGDPLAILWSFACHPVGFPEPSTASADFVGIVRESLRQKYGERLPILFAPGCMGDVRPRSPAPWKTIRNLPQIVIFGPSALGFDRCSWDDWAANLAAEVQEIAAASDKRILGEQDFSAVAAELPAEKFFAGTSPVPALRGKAVHIPGIGAIITLNCEPVTAIAELIHQPSDGLVLGYEGNVFGYLPTDSMIAEGGYEPYRFMEPFGLKGVWKPRLDDQVRAFGATLSGVACPETPSQ